MDTYIFMIPAGTVINQSFNSGISLKQNEYVIKTGVPAETKVIWTPSLTESTINFGIYFDSTASGMTYGFTESFASTGTTDRVGIHDGENYKNHSASSRILVGSPMYVRVYINNTQGKTLTLTNSVICEVYTEQKTQVTVSANTGGTVTNVSGNYADGTSINLSATPSSGYVFDKWTATSGTIANALSASTTFTVPLVNSVSVTANFIAIPRCTVTVSATTGGTVTNVSGDYDIGSVINLSATPSSSYKFNRWVSSGGIVADIFSANTTFVVPKLSPVTITAYFDAISNTPSQAGRYNGSSWDGVIPMRYDGTNWVECELQRYDGSSWDDVATN